MPTSSETNTDLVDIAFDSLLSQNLASIDEELGLLVNLDAMVCQPLHHFFAFWALRFVASMRLIVL